MFYKYALLLTASVLLSSAAAASECEEINDLIKDITSGSFNTPLEDQRQALDTLVVARDECQRNFDYQEKLDTAKSLLGVQR